MRFKVAGSVSFTTCREFDFYSSERIIHYKLCGRTTNVFPRGAIPSSRQALRNLSARGDASERSRDFEGCRKGHRCRLLEKHSESTTLRWAGELYVIIFRKLQPITELSGDEFLRAWWHTEFCYRAL